MSHNKCDQIDLVSLSRSYSFELALHGGRPLLRTKDAMSQEDWLPMGGAQFGTPMLHPKPASVPPTKFVFVVRVHAVVSFWTAIESDQARLSTCRSVISFPLEEAGAYGQGRVARE